ncbi:hypothetical protein QOT17_024737 [Balamuthia mandrillaris]
MAFQPPSKLKSTAHHISSKDFEKCTPIIGHWTQNKPEPNFLWIVYFFLMALIQETRAVRPSKQQLLLAGHLVCYKAIQLWLALSNKKFYTCMDLWKMGATLPLHHNHGLVWHSTTYLQTKAWLTVYFVNMGESLPNSEVIQIPMILN